MDALRELARRRGLGDEVLGDGDLWRMFYLAGKLQHYPAETHYPSFDPRKLEPAYWEIY